MKGFFAYSSEPSIAETIKSAITTINGAGVIEIKAWERLNIAGVTLIKAICESINESDVFLVDLTRLNPNVLFELGYAIARNKRIVLFLDTNIEKSKSNFDRFGLSTLGYIPYSNSQDMVNGFYKNEPYSSLGKTPLNETKELFSNQVNGTLYLKTPIDTQASIRLSQLISKTKIRPLTIDDPHEIRMQNHTWYIENTYKHFAFVGHLLNDEHSGRELHNAKVSFAAGLAFGFGRKIIMYAHEPYVCPIDYRHLLKKHSTAVECGNLFSQWILEVETLFLEDQKREIESSFIQKDIENLKNISLGDYIAEQEIETISDYFIPTSAYNEAFNSEYSLFVGRKGSGKSAILYKLENDLNKDNRNHVCIIKPVSYDLDGLIDLLKSIEGDSEKGFLIESVWKYLIYTEIAKSIYTLLEARPPYYELIESELTVKNIISENKDLFLTDFSSRLEQIINNFINIDYASKGLNFKKNVSEILHDNLLARLREIIYNYFKGKNRITIMIDNLDKTWKPSKNISYLSSFLLGLLSITNRIANDFIYDDKKKHKTKFSIIVFLRMDIFSYITKEAREKDKLRYSIITWNDNELLLLLIEERFKVTTGISDSSIIWTKYFPDNIKNIPIKEFLIKNILPRPRDIIFYVKHSLLYAITRKHNSIQENDILDAQEKYSQYVVDSLIVENGVNIEDFEKILYEFIGSNKIVSKDDIDKIVLNSGVQNLNSNNFIQLLCDRCFLGRKTGIDEYRYQFNFLEGEKIEKLAARYLENNEDKMEYFEINKPFRKFFEISDV